jgi:hypothetical protein
MRTKRLIQFTILASGIVILFGCDKVCKSSVNETATFQNQTGQSLSFSLCKRGNNFDGSDSTKVDVDLSSETSEQSVALGSKSVQTISGGLDAAHACSSAHYSYTPSRVDLSAESATDIKLCKTNGDLHFIAISANEACPDGTDEQRITTDCE